MMLRLKQKVFLQFEMLPAITNVLLYAVKLVLYMPSRPGEKIQLNFNCL